MANIILWNIDDNDCIELINLYSIEIIKKSEGEITLSLLIDKLNKKTVDHNIHNIKRMNKFSRYLKYKYGNAVKFYESLNHYSIVNNNSKIHIKLHPQLITYSLNKRITKDSEWIFI